jgi:Family of unknown function (DUF6982)
MSTKVVARYRDGRLIKGISQDIQPTKATFHVRGADGKVVPVNLSDLKAVFYVRTLEGNSKYEEDLKPNPEDVRSRGSTLITLRFEDGETMVCLTNGLPRNRQYYFVVPVDARSNNIRILVNQAAVVSIEVSGGDQPISQAS